MSNKPFKFGQIFPTGTIALLCGIGAITTLPQDLAIACLIGTVGISIGVLTLRMQVEKLDKILAVIGTIFSLIPIIYTIIALVKR